MCDWMETPCLKHKKLSLYIKPYRLFTIELHLFFFSRKFVTFNLICFILLTLLKMSIYRIEFHYTNVNFPKLDTLFIECRISILLFMVFTCIYICMCTRVQYIFTRTYVPLCVCAGLAFALAFNTCLAYHAWVVLFHGCLFCALNSEVPAESILLLVCNLYFWLTIFGVFNLILPMPCCKSFQFDSNSVYSQLILSAFSIMLSWNAVTTNPNAIGS